MSNDFILIKELNIEGFEMKLGNQLLGSLPPPTGHERKFVFPLKLIFFSRYFTTSQTILYTIAFKKNPKKTFSQG